MHPARRGLGLTILAALLATAPGLAGVAPAATVYASPSGGGRATGLSAAHPRRAQAALDAARDGDRILLLDGTYPALTLRARDEGPGVVAVEALNPVLDGIDVAAGRAARLRASGGAFLAGGLALAGHDGVLLAGFSFGGSERGLAVGAGTRNVVAERNRFRENRSFGVLILPGAGTTTVRASLFENHALQPDGPGWLMDYGLATYADAAVAVTGNLYRGSFNQATSVKELSALSFAGNAVLIDRGSGVLCGQEPDTADKERTARSCVVEGNRFVRNGYYGVRLFNVATAVVRDNDFVDATGIMHVRHQANLDGSAIRPPWPTDVLFAGNRIAGGGRIRIEGRGVRGDAVRIEGNAGGALCEALPLGDRGFAGVQTTEPPRVDAAPGNGFACR